MRWRTTAPVVCLWACVWMGQSADADCNRGSLPATSFNLSRLSEHARVLSSDEFEGRGLAGPGEAKTLDYITRQFLHLGLEPAGDEGGWTQRVPLRRIELAKSKRW